MKIKWILITYKLRRGQEKASSEYKEGPRLGINDLHSVEGPEKASSEWVDRRPQIRNQWLTFCGWAREGKLRVSRQKVPDQKSMTYTLWGGQRRQAQSEWTEGPRSEINDLHSVEGPGKASSEWVDRRLHIRNQWLTHCGWAREGKLRVSGQKAPDQKSMTYMLWGGQRRQAQSEWTEGPRSEINDLHPVEGPEKASSEWVDRRPQIRNQWLTSCGWAREGKLRVSGQKAPDQTSMTYILWRGQRRQAQSEWTEGPDQKSMTYMLWRGQRRHAQD